MHRLTHLDLSLIVGPFVVPPSCCWLVLGREDLP